MSSALDILFASEAAERIITFLGTRGERARIIAPGWVRERVLADASPDGGASQAHWIEHIDARPPRDESGCNYIVIAENANRERAIIATLSYHKGIKVYGLYGDILPALLCGARGLSRRRPLENVKRYAVLCVPRSGSRYLVSVLNRYGLGAPREHLREPLAVAITRGRLGFKRAFAELERFGRNNDIFGTKLISTFLITACNGDLSEMENNIRWMIDRGYKFVYLDRDLNDAVVSNYIASRLQKWHFFEQLDETTRSLLDRLEFDKESAWNEYIRFRAQKVTIAYLAEKFGMPTCAYSKVQQSVDSVATSISRALDVDLDQLKPGSASVPVATRTESASYESFSSALANLLKERRDLIVPRTATMLRKLVAADESSAKHLAATPVP